MAPDTGGLTWAWSIVALTVLVRILLVPLAIRQIHSMQSLQMHAPEMKAIQQRYRVGPAEAERRAHEVLPGEQDQPYASCLPIVFQIPIFIALFFVLRDFEDEIFPKFPESSLQWLNLVDITEPTKDGWGPVLLVVYVVSQLASTWLMSTQMQSTAQRVMMIMVLPVVFIPFILSFPSGLMIYWLTTNLWTTGQGIVIVARCRGRARRRRDRAVRRRRRSPHRLPVPDSAAAAAPAGGAASSAPRRVRKEEEGGRPRR